MKLFDFLNNHPDMYADEPLYLHALKYCEAEYANPDEYVMEKI